MKLLTKVCTTVSQTSRLIPSEIYKERERVFSTLVMNIDAINSYLGLPMAHHDAGALG